MSDDSHLDRVVAYNKSTKTYKVLDLINCESMDMDKIEEFYIYNYPFDNIKILCYKNRWIID